MVNPGSQKIFMQILDFHWLLSSLSFAFIVDGIEQLNRSISKFFSMSTGKKKCYKIYLSIIYLNKL